jgi:dUTP pyrophosphatase
MSVFTTNIPLKRATKHSAGYDIISPLDIELRAGERMLIKTGIKLTNMKDGHYLQIKPKSGHAFKHGVDVLAGVIDSDYRGEIGVILFNTSKCHKNPEFDPVFRLEKGKSMAQAVCQRYYVADEEDIVHEKERGNGAYGSSGI